MNMLDREYLTVREAADVLGLSAARIRQFLMRGQIQGSYFGHVRAIPKTEVQRFAKLDRPPGNPAFRK